MIVPDPTAEPGNVQPLTGQAEKLAQSAKHMEKSAGTAVARDQALAADQQAQGQILADQANLDTANINLGYTDIASPISGKVSKTNVTAGNVVGPASGILTLIVSQDPMYISFPVSQRELLQAQLSGRVKDIAGIKIKIRFADGTTYKQEGTVNFVDVSVDRATDTVLARATMPNPDGALIDGQLVSVAVEAGAFDGGLEHGEAGLPVLLGLGHGLGRGGQRGGLQHLEQLV